MIFFNIIMPVFVIIFFGFIFQKLKNPDFKSISDFTLYFLTPCLIFKGLVNSKLNLSHFITDGIIFMVCLTASLWFISFIVEKLLKFDSLKSSAFSLSTIMMNTGNFGIPLILFAYGQDGFAYAVINLVLFTFPLGTLAVFIASKGKSSIKNSLFEILKVPLFHAIILATIFRHFNIALPDVILKPINLIGDAAIPALLMLLGMQLARTNLGSDMKPVFIATFIRLLVSPIIAILLCNLLGITGLPYKVLVIQTSTPSAIIPLLYAVNYNSRPDIVASVIFFSTIFSAATLTILLAII